MRIVRPALPLLIAALTFPLTSRAARAPQTTFDIIIRGGTVYDGTGAPGRRADIGIQGDRIAGVGDLTSVQSTSVIDASGLAVAPGFINMLSWSNESLLIDGRSQGEVREGVTTQIFGEGSSMGPLTPEMKRRMIEQMGDLKYPITWNSLSEYLRHLEEQGISQNVASFIGATTVRENVVGFDDVAPTPAQLKQMQDLVRQAMREGALGVGSSLIYAPASYAQLVS